MKNRTFYMIEKGDLDELALRLADRVLTMLQESGDAWVGAEKAMKLLGIKSKTTLQKYRDEKRIRFSQVDKKVIMYDRASINEYLNKNA